MRTTQNIDEDLLKKATVSHLPDDDLGLFCENELHRYFQKILEDKSMASDSTVWDLLKSDLRLNAAGIAHSARKARKIV